MIPSASSNLNFNSLSKNTQKHFQNEYKNDDQKVNGEFEERDLQKFNFIVANQQTNIFYSSNNKIQLMIGYDDK